MKVQVLIPYASQDNDRLPLLEWTSRRFSRQAGDVLVCQGGMPWSKGQALRNAADQVDADVVIVADADVFIETKAIHEALHLVESGKAPWVVPHRMVLRLKPEPTDHVLADCFFDGTALARHPYKGVPGGGLVVLPRAALDLVPCDPRFVGWGGEDVAWGWALDEILGRHARLEADLWHLWHKPQSDHGRLSGSSQALFNRYRTARKAGTIHRLIEEIT